MNWAVWIPVLGALAFLVALRRLAILAPAAARDWLKRGAQVIDVRSEAEFKERHLPGAMNIPLPQLSEEILRRVPDKEQGLLLHCLSGGRSAVAKGVLKRMGYRNAFNLGSYRRAERILAGPPGAG